MELLYFLASAVADEKLADVTQTHLFALVLAELTDFHPHSFLEVITVGQPDETHIDLE